jgi:hypothetical protein
MRGRCAITVIRKKMGSPQSEIETSLFECAKKELVEIFVGQGPKIACMLKKATKFNEDAFISRSAILGWSG